MKLLRDLIEMETKTKPILWLPIGASGTGKSTFLKQLQRTNPDIVSFSWDDLRHEWYDQNDYSNAFRLSTRDKDFEKKARARFESIINTGVDVFVDNTNLTVKRRAYYIQLAKQHGYKTIGIEMPVDVDTIVKRQLTRGDKNVSADVVRDQFNKLERPAPGEFDDVVISNHNIVDK